LPVRWRALVLVVLHDLFGPELVPDAVLPEAALILFGRAAPMSWGLQNGGRHGDGKRTINAAAGRVQRLSKRPVHR